MINRLDTPDNPLLSREIRRRFRDDRAFMLIFLLATGLALFFALLYSSIVSYPTSRGRGAASSISSGQSIFTQLSWMQTLAWLLISPALTSASIAYERERGWFDSLMLSRLSPRAIVLGKWGSALLFAAILGSVTVPLMALVFVLGGVTARQFLLVGLLHIACAMCGAAIGLAASAWSPRASSALRTAYGMILIGLVASFYGAAAVGELPFRFVPGGAGGAGNDFWRYLGRTNPVLRSLEISGDLAFQHFGFCLGFLLAATLAALAIATFYANRALEEAPILQRKTAKSLDKTTPKTRSTHGEIPLLSRLRFANPVLDREVRSKFRMRQPPLAVIVAEVLLATLVAIFYVRTLFSALFEPVYHELIWWGLYTTGMIVTMMAAAVMGANGMAREREGGTWEGVRLSLLSPFEIVSGKVGASLLSCALFSLPVWPLLLPCIGWDVSQPTRSAVPISDVLNCLAVWIAIAWSYTLIGLWIGRRAPRTSRASGQTLGFLTAYLMLGPIVAISSDIDAAMTVLEATHPAMALAESSSRGSRSVMLFCTFQGLLGLALGAAVHRSIEREIGSAGEAESTQKKR